MVAGGINSTVATLRSIELRNYRRFQGEIAFDLCPGINLIYCPPGKGKSTILEAISWCLQVDNAIPEGEVPNAIELASGHAEVMVAIDFAKDRLRLERSATFLLAQEGGRLQSTRWSVIDQGDKEALTCSERERSEEVVGYQERLFPETCAYSNLISGPCLGAVLTGGRGGVERAVESSNMWCCSDLPLRSSADATRLFSDICPSSTISGISYDPSGHLEVQLSSPAAVGPHELRVALLSHALGFAKENERTCPIILDEPFHSLGPDVKERTISVLLDFLAGRQVIFLLSNEEEVAVLRASGRLDRELEIWG